MSKRSAAALVIALIALAAAAAFIFGSSLDHAAESTAKSDAAADAVEPLFSPLYEFFTGEKPTRLTLVRFVRKGAHFAEFFVIGAVLTWVTLLLPGGFKWERVFLPLFFSLLAAVGDEFLQTFLDRSGQVRDVVLDFAGAACGIGLVLLIARAHVKGKIGKRKGWE